MAVVVEQPGVDGLGDVVAALRNWQVDDGPMQLHPGDLGWFWRFGAEATAAAVRIWRRDGVILAVGLLDEPTVLRLAIAPAARDDAELARRLVEDVGDPGRGVLVAGKVGIEAPSGTLVRNRLAGAGWDDGEPWTPLRRDLAGPVPDPGVRIGTVGPEEATVRTAVHRASFERSTFTDERWSTMADGLPYADARCLLAYAGDRTPVAAVTVWSAGPGRPGLLEPMGVHRDHRGSGFGRAITLAAAAALQQLGSSSALVCTPSANAGGVATYVAAGFRELPKVRDRCREI